LFSDINVLQGSVVTLVTYARRGKFLITILLQIY